jgi:hypothetical protein
MLKRIDEIKIKELSMLAILIAAMNFFISRLHWLTSDSRLRFLNDLFTGGIELYGRYIQRI